MQSLVLLSLHHEKSPQAIPLGTACLAAAVKARPELARQWNIVLMDVWPGEDLGQVLARLDNHSPRVIGFSTYVWNQKQVAELITTLATRGRPGNPLIALGGPAAFDPAMAGLPGVDKVITGEGEEAFCSWLEGLGKPGRPAFPAQTTVPADHAAPTGTTDPATPPPLRVENLASPWLDGTLVPGTLPGVVWEAARGCPFQCSYCLESRGVPGVRPFPKKRLEAELRLFGKAGVDQIFVLDPTFNYREDRCLELLELMDRHCPGTHLHLEVRAEFITPAQAEAFASLPCSLQIGLQSADPEIMKQLKRPFNPQVFRDRIGLLNRTGAVFGLDLIWGLPGDSLEGFSKSLDWALALEPNNLDLFPLSVLPGTALAGESEAFGLDWDRNPPFLVKSAPGFTTSDMAAAARLAEGVKLFYNRGRAVGWFMRVVRLLGTTPVLLIQDFQSWMEGRRSGSNKPIPSPGRHDRRLQTGSPSRPDPGASRPPLASGQPAPPTVLSGQAEIHLLQKDFLLTRLAAVHADQPALAGVVSDLVAFHSAWAALVVDGNPSSCLLNYDPEVLNGPEGRKLDVFARTRKPRPQTWRFFNSNGQPNFEPGRQGRNSL